MALSITHTPVYCTDLDEALAFYTQRLGFEVRDDVPMGPEMRWLTVHAPGDPHDLLLAAVDHHIPPANRQAMREIVAKGDLAVFIQVDDLDKTFESLRAAGTEILQEPIDQPYGVRDAAVRDPSGNIRFVLSTKKDVSHLKVLRDAKLVEARFRNLIESVPDAIVIINATGRIVLANSQAEKLFDYSPGARSPTAVGCAVTRPFSPPRVELAVDRLEPLAVHVGVVLRRADVGVAEHLLNGPQVGAAG